MLATLLQQLSSSTTGATDAAKKSSRSSNSEAKVIVFMACVCAILPLDISQLAFAIIGAVFYAVLQQSDHFAPKKAAAPGPVNRTPPSASQNTRNCKAKVSHVRSGNLSAPAVSTKAAPPTISKSEVRTNSVQPIAAPTFQSKDWDGEVMELVAQIEPTQQVEDVVNQLALIMSRVIKKVFPEAEVNGYANGNFTFGKAFGVAVPEVDVIANVNPQILFDRLHGRSAQRSQQLDVKKLQKSAIRACTDQLISGPGFKFRRSAFGGQEPKVTLLAPATLGLFSDPIPIDFSVNVVTPLYNTALLTECGKIDKRAKDLILLVRRWSKMRGICHAAKGHLSPYLWSLLTMYYLQVGVSNEEPLLPPLDQFEMSSGLMTKASDAAKDLKPEQAKWHSNQGAQCEKSTGALFKDFMNFFDVHFDWHKEAVSVRLGQRAPPSAELHVHHVVSEETKTSEIGPSIEDPFNITQNLGDSMNAGSVARLKEEISRAQALCLRGASLSEVLEPWAPADPESSEGKQEGDEIGNIEQKTAETTLPEAVVKGEDWRRDAKEAQAVAATASTPPWRRNAAKKPNAA